jgi:hypothetical protein
MFGIGSVKLEYLQPWQMQVLCSYFALLHKKYGARIVRKLLNVQQFIQKMYTKMNKIVAIGHTWSYTVFFEIVGLWTLFEYNPP